MKSLQSAGLTRTVIIAILIFGLIGAIGFQSYAMASLAAAITASALLALSLDLAWGYTGILSLGHGLFFGVPAYATALCLRAGVENFLLLALIALATGALLALIIGVLMFVGRTELPLIYIVMATLALSFAAEQVARSWPYVGADTGMAGLVPPEVFGLDTLNPYVYLGVCLVVLVLVFTLFAFLTIRDWGVVLTGIRENEKRMQFSGYRTAKTKVQVFCISGAVAGLGGFLYAFNIGIVSPGMLGVTQSTLVVVWVLAGGLGTLVGPMLGAVVVSYLSDRLSSAIHGWWEVTLGMILMLVLVAFPDGLLGLVTFRGRRKSRLVEEATPSSPGGVR